MWKLSKEGGQHDSIYCLVTLTTSIDRVLPPRSIIVIDTNLDCEVLYCIILNV
jgi:hypothetical protein